MDPVPAAASLAVRPVLDGPPQPARILGRPSGAVHLRCADDSVLTVVGPGGVRLPCALVLGDTTARSALSDVAGTTAVTVGSGGLRFGPADPGVGRRTDGIEPAPGRLPAVLAVQVVRWWDPRPRVTPSTPPAAARRRAAAALPEPAVDLTRLRTAVGSGDREAVAAAARSLAGLGPGLTPAGDDVLTGLVAAWRVLDRCTDLIPPVLAAAEGRTTDLAAALLRHAADGACAAELGHLLGALTGHGDPVSAVARLRAVGHSTGVAWAWGALLGAGPIDH